jgi:hypothetical protein
MNEAKDNLIALKLVTLLSSPSPRNHHTSSLEMDSLTPIPASPISSISTGATNTIVSLNTTPTLSTALTSTLKSTNTSLGTKKGFRAILLKVSRQLLCSRKYQRLYSVAFQARIWIPCRPRYRYSVPLSYPFSHPSLRRQCPSICINASSCDLMKDSTRNCPGTLGIDVLPELGLWLECCTVIWYITLYFHRVAGCPEAEGGHRGQWFGMLVQGELHVGTSKPLHKLYGGLLLGRQ